MFKTVNEEELKNTPEYKIYYINSLPDDDYQKLKPFFNSETKYIRSYALSRLIKINKEEARVILESLLEKSDQRSEENWINLIIWEEKEIIERHINKGLNNNSTNIRKLILNYVKTEMNQVNYEKIDCNLIIDNIRSSDRETSLLSASLLEYLPEKNQKKGLDILWNSNDANFISIGMRIEHLKSDIDFYKMLKKASYIEKNSKIRPEFTSSWINTSHPSEYDRYLIDLNNNEEEKILNMGIIGNYFSSILKQKYNKDSEPLIKGYTVGESLPLDYAKDFVSIYLTKTKESKLSIFNSFDTTKYQFLLSHNNPVLKLTCLLYLEEIIDVYPKTIDIVKQDLKKLTHDKDKKIKQYAQFILLRNLEKEEIQQMINGELKNINKQVLWWGIGGRREHDLTELLMKDIDSWESDKILSILEDILPFTIVSSDVFLKIWRILFQNRNEIKGMSYRYSKYVNINTLFLYLDWMLVRSLDCGKGTFQPNQRKIITKGIEFIQKNVNSAIRIHKEAIIGFIIELSKSDHNYFWEMGNEILLELRKKSFSDYMIKLDSSETKNIQNIECLLIRHFDFLNDKNKLKLIKYMITKYDLNPDNYEFIVEKVLEINNPTYEILNIIEKIIIKLDQIQTPFIHLEVYKIWDKHIPILMEQKFNDVVSWMITLAQSEKLNSISFYRFPKNILRKLYDYLILKEINSGLYWRVFYALFSKPLYVLPGYWNVLLNEK